MAQTTIQSNNKLVVFGQQLIREFVRENMFSPYMGKDITSVIVQYYDGSKNGGDQINVPLLRALSTEGTGADTLVGNEEKIPNYGMRMWADWLRNAVEVTEDELRKDSADIISVRKPILTDWAKRALIYDILRAYMALPNAAAPTGIGAAPGSRANGILYSSATAAQRNTWNQNNSDRVLYGNDTTNYNATHATALANVDTTNDTFVENSVTLMKQVALSADPAISPVRTKDGYETFVAFAGTKNFYQLRNSMAGRWQYSMERGANNPLYRSGDIIVDDVVVRHVPDIDKMVDNVWTTLKTAGASSTRVAPVFLCGQASLVWSSVKPIRYKPKNETDYDFRSGLSVSTCYGVCKSYDEDPATAGKLVQRGVVTGFFSAV